MHIMLNYFVPSGYTWRQGISHVVILSSCRTRVRLQYTHTKNTHTKKTYHHPGKARQGKPLERIKRSTKNVQ